MGKSKTTIHERQLTPEERQLIAMQGRYLESIQPSIDALVKYGTGNIQNIVTPNWQQLYDAQTNEMDQIKKNLHLLVKVSTQIYNAKQRHIIF